MDVMDAGGEGGGGEGGAGVWGRARRARGEGGVPVARMDVMDAVVKVMEDEGVEVVFGVPRAAILPLYKAMSGSDQIRHYSVRHEEGRPYRPVTGGWAGPSR